MDKGYIFNLVFILIWIGFWVYLAFHYIKYPSRFVFWKKLELRKNYLNLAAIVGLAIAPFIWVNYHQDSDYFDYKRRFEKVSENGTVASLGKFHQYALYKYPDNARVNIEYMIYSTHWGLKSWMLDLAEFYNQQIEIKKQSDKYKLLSELGYCYSGLKAFQHDLHAVDTNELEGLYHYVLAEYAIKQGKMEEAQGHFILALKDRELAELAYTRLEYLWLDEFTIEQMAKFAYDPNVYPFMPFHLKREIYINDGAWGWYLYNGLDRDFFSADLPAYIGVGLALFVWMLFITEMLFIQGDKWKYIIPLFVLGAMFPIMVYVLHDLLEWLYGVLDVEFNYQSLADCIINIGIIEELVKVIPWVIFYLLYKKHFHRPVHFMLLPVVSALGFAFSENLIYVNSNDYELVFLRSSISLVMHISCSAIVGYMVWRAQLQRDRLYKLFYIFGGFFLAAVLHGLFDFIIYGRGGYLNIIIMLITLHLFILFINNAINFSGIKDKNSAKRLHQAGIILLVGLLVIFIAQYLVVGWHFSPGSANSMLKANAIFVVITTIYLVATFRKVKLRPRVLYKFSFADVFGQFLTTSKGNYMDEVNYKDWELKLFAPKDNVFVGSQFPVKVTAIKRVVVQKDLRWWLIKFENPVRVSGTNPEYALLRAKENEEDLYMDKVEVMLMMIPDWDAFNNRSTHHSSQFVYTGRVYSRPVFVPVVK